MNNQLSGLDPKLAEKYHQVMNTPLPASPTPTPQPVQAQPIQPIQNPVPTVPQTPEPAPIPVTVPNAEPKMQTTESTIPQPMFANMPEQPQRQEVVTPTVQVAAPINVKNSQVFKVSKKSGKISPVIIVLGVVVFILVYTLVWVKIFNLKLPFLP